MEKGNRLLCKLFIISLCLLGVTFFPIMGNANNFTGAIGDFVWNDLNGNALQDFGEPGINGVLVQLLNSSSVVLATTVTAGSGLYQFTQLSSGDYYISIPTLPAGYIFTVPDVGSDSSEDSDFSSSGTAFVNLPSDNSVDLTIDAGILQRTQPVPEPATMLLLASGLLGLASFRRKFSKRG